MSEDNIYVGKFLNGKKIVDTSTDAKFVNFFYEDGSYDVAPIIDGKVVVTLDGVTVSHETDYTDIDGVTIEVPDILNEDDTVLGFYKTLEPIAYTDEEGNELGKTEVGSIQEVPVALGDMWVAEGLAEKVDEPEKESLLSKMTGGLLGNK